MPTARTIAIVVALLATLAASRPVAAAEADGWRLDPVHTRVVFAVSHAGFSQALGAVSGSTGTLRFDGTDWARAALTVQVPLARLDLGDARWNAAALATNLLDAARHPHAVFVSDVVTPVDASHARVCGALTLRAVTAPLCLDVTLNQIRRHPLPPFRRTAGFSATGTLSRAQFGITAWKNVIGDRVDLRIEAEAVADRTAAIDDDARTPTDAAGEPSPSAPVDARAPEVPPAETSPTPASPPQPANPEVPTGVPAAGPVAAPPVLPPAPPATTPPEPAP